MSRKSSRSEFERRFSLAKARQALGAAASWPGRALRVRRERRQLARLDEAMLKDIGISKADAYREWSRAFWDLPSEFGDRQETGRGVCCE